MDIFWCAVILIRSEWNPCFDPTENNIPISKPTSVGFFWLDLRSVNHPCCSELFNSMQSAYNPLYHEQHTNKNECAFRIKKKINVIEVSLGMCTCVLLLMSTLVSLYCCQVKKHTHKKHSRSKINQFDKKLFNRSRWTFSPKVKSIYILRLFNTKALLVQTVPNGLCWQVKLFLQITRSCKHSNLFQITSPGMLVFTLEVLCSMVDVHLHINTALL